MAVEVYINFSGNCRQAMEFYSQVFGTEKPTIIAFGDMPADASFPISEEMKNLVAHASLNIRGSKVMFSDVPPGMPFIQGNNISLFITSTMMDEVKSLFNKMKEGGNVIMELQDTGWSKCYGMVTDKFGIGWQFNFESDQVGS